MLTLSHADTEEDFNSLHLLDVASLEKDLDNRSFSKGYRI